jgi:mono/diheme cytochrome c family protein
MPQFSFYFDGTAENPVVSDEIRQLVAYVQSLGGSAGVERAQRQVALKQKLLTERAKGNEAIIHEWFPTTWRNVRNPMEPSIRSLMHGKQIFLTNCTGCHGELGNGKGPATRFMGGTDGPAPRNLTDASQQLMFSDGELYDAILFGIDGTAMPPWGDILTVNDIWDVTNFIRTIPNGGVLRDPTSDMMVSPADVKPIEVTPLALPGEPGAITAVTPVPTRAGATPTP